MSDEAAVSLQRVLNRYHVWDARKILRLLPREECVDVTITSPPYWNLKDYGVSSQIGFGQTYDQCLEELREVFTYVYKVTKKKGSLWVISDTIKYKGEMKLLPFDLARRLTEIGWILQDIVIWNKDRTLPWSHRGKLRNMFEYITFYSKEREFNYHLGRVREIVELKDWWVRYPERYSPKGRAPARTWSIPIPRQGSWGNNWVRHFNPLPPELVERIIMLTTDEGDVVLDPFAGSGVVLAGADILGRRYLGLDLNSNYKEMFEQRVLPTIRSLRRHRVGRLQETERNQKTFGRLICSLRRTKYPKELIRLYRKEFGELELQAVVGLQRAATDRLEVVCLFSPGSRIPNDFLAQAEKLCRRPPLSKYGLHAGVTVVSVDVLSRAWLEQQGLDTEKERLYLYKEGRTYMWVDSFTVEDWLSVISNEASDRSTGRYPPIYSNVAVRVDPQSPQLHSDNEL